MHTSHSHSLEGGLDISADEAVKDLQHLNKRADMFTHKYTQVRQGSYPILSRRRLP